MRRHRLLALVPLALIAAPLSSVAASAPAASVHPTLVAIRTSHHPGFDRVVFAFQGGTPTHVRAAYVDRLVGDASGLPVRIAGRAILQVHIKPAQAHTDAGAVTAPGRTSYLLPNVMTTVRSGDFEGVVGYGLGLAARTPFHVFTLSNPGRVVVDVRAGFPTVPRKVWFFDAKRFTDNTQPFFLPRLRPVRPAVPATAVLDRLFAGPTRAEQAAHLRLLRSGASGFRLMSIQDGIARVQLTGGCSSGGSTVTVAGEIMPTLRQFASVDWVKIYGPAGHTERPTGPSDSIPTCLEP